MRLLNTTTFELKEFLDEDLPEYAILSHTWIGDEIVYQDLQTRDGSWKKKTKSFKKLSGFGSIALESGYAWCWIDTVCIDKSSSAELSEAINSMFRWYARSHVCFAYLSDVRVDHADPDEVEQFEMSRWHMRGWTLQELLAPERVEFYDVNWHQFGTRTTLNESISRITGIRAEVLKQKFDVQSSQKQYCVAEKMSWAANRGTSRVEDLAYCLLGIFDINMPLLYGEGNRAFERLQFQILAETEDLTLFAWKGKSPDIKYGRSLFHRSFHHLIAESPSDFCESTSDCDSWNWTYQSLDAGSYDQVWNDLDRLCAEPDSTLKTHSSGFVPEQPAKRLGTIKLSMAVLPGIHGPPDYVILCKLRDSKNLPSRRHLCLPIESRKSSLYQKRGLPIAVGLKDRSHDIYYRHFSLVLTPVLGLIPPTICPHWQSAVILCIRGEGNCSNSVFIQGSNDWHISALLLRHRSAEFLVLHGITEVENTGIGKPDVLGWSIVATWEEFSSIRNLLICSPEMEKKGRGDFARHRLCNGAYAYCAIKRRLKDWFLSQNVAAWSKEREFQGFFSLEISVKNAFGQSERVEFLGWADFGYGVKLEYWLDSPNPRQFLLSMLKSQVTLQ